MNETQTATNGHAAEPKPGEAMIDVLRDQRDEWRDVVAKDNHQLMTFDTAVEWILAVHEADGRREDVVIKDLDKWLFVGPLDEPEGAYAVTDGKRLVLLRDTSFSQLCERAKAPGGYLRSIPTRYALPALNWGLRHRTQNGKATLRLARPEGHGTPEARAILSDRYARFDDQVILPIMRQTLVDARMLDGLSVRAVGTGLTTVLRLGLADAGVSVPGTEEVVEVALDITNGEVGNRAVSLAPVAYLRHRNIATRRTTIRLRHLGNEEKLAEDFREALPMALAEGRKLVGQIVAAVDKAISDLVTEAEKLRGFGLSIPEARDVLRGVAQTKGIDLPHDTAEWEGPLATVGNLSVYDVFCAVAALGDGRSIDRRLELEEAAAKYLARALKS